MTRYLIRVLVTACAGVTYLADWLGDSADRLARWAAGDDLGERLAIAAADADAGWQPLEVDRGTLIAPALARVLFLHPIDADDSEVPPWARRL
jgi:hypothetical protein